MENPYTPPASDVAAGTEQDTSGTLASRGNRFLGALIDGILMMVLIMPVMFLSGFWEAAANAGGASFMFNLMALAASFLTYCLINGYLLAQSGQTVGKKIMKTKIVNMDGSQPPLAHILLRRLLPVQLLVLVPFVGNFLSLVDALFVFRDDRRCIHDHIAGTKVINA